MQYNHGAAAAAAAALCSLYCSGGILKKEEAIFSTATMAVVAPCVEMGFTQTIFVKSQPVQSEVIYI